jgi:hypothetical protein
MKHQPALDPARLVFLDETWATICMARTLASRGAVHSGCPERPLENHDVHR